MCQTLNIPVSGSYVRISPDRKIQQQEKNRQEQEKAQKLQKLLQWLIPCSEVFICTAAAVTILLVRRKKKHTVT